MSRAALHWLVDELPEDLLDVPAELLEAYRRGNMTILMIAALTEEAEADGLAALDRQTSTDLELTRAFEQVEAELRV